jgi:hypothetical protein
MKVWLSLLVALTLGFSGTLAIADEGDAWVPNITRGAAGTNSFFIAEATQGNLLSTRTGGKGAENWWCDEFTGNLCSLSDQASWFSQYSVLPVCLTSTQEDCVESLTVSKGEAKSTNLTFMRQVDGIKFAPQPSLGIMEGSTVSLWSDTTTSKNYAVNVRVLQYLNRQTGKFEPQSMSAIVMPYRLQSGNYGVPAGHTQENSKGSGSLGVSIENIAQECVWNDLTGCGILHKFGDDTKAALTIRLTKKIGGWFMGRLANPDITISNFSKTASRVTVDASPVDVPRLQATVPSDSGITNIQQIWRNSGVMGAEWDGSAAFNEGYGGGAFSYLETFRKFTNDVAAGVTNLWSFSTVASVYSNECLADTSRVMGIVTTNATVYEGASPAFIGGQLTYKVAGLHYQPDGVQLNLGSYDLLIRSDAARCLYGFTKAPVQASISVVSEKGTKSTATTVVKETNDGWLKLSAKGFTFSNKVIKVKLGQSNKKYSITCAKGKLKKKVTGSSPKCPAGYKQS